MVPARLYLPGSMLRLNRRVPGLSHWVVLIGISLRRREAEGGQPSATGSVEAVGRS